MLVPAHSPSRILAIVVFATVAALLLTLTPRNQAVTRAAEAPPKVAIIVGPVGEQLTPTYLALAEMAAAEAESRGATVARAYSPDATPERVIAAVDGASIVIYFGHGTGFPNPYSDVPNPETVNGWGLQGPGAMGNHDDSLGTGALRYYGEAWLTANLHPAPGFVMIYSNACYAPGASEGSQPQPTEEEALAHVANYSAPVLALGASAYFATDFYAGAARLVATLLDQPASSYGEVFRSDPLFIEAGLAEFDHPASSSARVWLHRSPYFENLTDYWYAFAGDPSRGFATRLTGREGVLGSTVATTLIATGRASSYGFTPGFEGTATVALPDALGGVPWPAQSGSVVVCGDRCVELPVVDSCPCYWGTTDQRVANLSNAAWVEVTDAPLAEGLVDVRLYPVGQVPAGESPQALRLETVAVAPRSDVATQP